MDKIWKIFFANIEDDENINRNLKKGFKEVETKW